MIKKRCEVLYNLITENRYKNFIELGVERGETSKYLLDNIPDLEVTCIDPYARYQGVYGSHHGSMKELLRKYKWAQNNVFINERCTFHRMYSKDAVKLFEPESVDIVFIDANHFYDWIKEDIGFWWPIVRKGGVLCGHDYIDRNKWGVVRAVNEFVEDNNFVLNLENDKVWWVKK